VRIGIHLGDILAQPNGDVLGDGVNIAARLQALAEPDTICISDMVYRDVAKKIPLGTVISLGRPQLKNIARRFPVYILLSERPKGFRQRLHILQLQLSQRVGTVHLARATLVIVGLLIGGGLVTLLFPSLIIRTPQSEIRNQEAQPPLLPLPDKLSLVVLPLDNMSGDPQQDYFSNGITEVLTSDLSRISSLFVIARNTAFTYKGKAINVQEIGKELGVRYVLEGSVQKAGDQVRIVVQLIDTNTGGHLWSQRYDRPLKDIFALQDEIVQRLVSTLRVEVLEAELARVRHIPTTNLTAYDSLLRGMDYFNRFTKEANAQARQLYEQAIALDPQYALAYTCLGFTHWTDFTFQWSQDPQSLERAFELAQKAIALDASEPYVHMLLGAVYLRQKRFEEAIAEAKEAITLDPNNADAYVRLAENLSVAGRPAEALGFVQQAMRLNLRHSVWYLFNLGLAYRLTGQYTEATAALEKARTRNPNFLATHMSLAFIYSELGREEEARAEVVEVLRINPNFSLETWTRSALYKDPADLERMLAALRKAGLK
jgi:TolB-like protein/Flp pilus assembly protein TadD